MKFLTGNYVWLKPKLINHVLSTYQLEVDHLPPSEDELACTQFRAKLSRKMELSCEQFGHTSSISTSSDHSANATAEITTRVGEISDNSMHADKDEEDTAEDKSQPLDLVSCRLFSRLSFSYVTSF